MNRRQFLSGVAGSAAAAGLARPALAQGDSARTLRFVPQANLTSLDPVWTTAARQQKLRADGLRHALWHRRLGSRPGRRWRRAIRSMMTGQRWTIGFATACASMTARRCWRATARRPSRAG